MRARMHGRALVVLLTASGLAALAWANWMPPTAHVVYNPTDSVPVGWYRIRSADVAALAAGDIVLVRLPPDATQLAARRGYLPANVPLLKRVGAVAPQRVCVLGASVNIDGVPAAALLRTDRRGRPLSAWRQCRPLQAGEVFLVGAHPASFDSRYFGPIDAAAVLGIAHPLWLDTPP
ncbi:TPA: S26 family signal peptidase [Stenotrophomonas maltophilia]|nr:S26 family signal peptidase [Stenotrophomonas maltophilia]